jgi:hypothetical protein
VSSTLSLLLDTVNLTNDVEISGPIKSRADAEEQVPPDQDGKATIAFLTRTDRIASRIVGSESRSLGLHPLVYFYSDAGRHLPTSFLATMEWMSRQDKANSFKEFTLVRRAFEEFLLANKDLVSQISRNSRGQIKAVHKIREFFEFVVAALSEGKDSTQIADQLYLSKDFAYLKPPAPPILSTQVKDFSVEAKSRAFITHALATAARCAICGARIPDSGISHDHKLDQKEGGVASLENHQFTHHYCNSAKDQLLPLFAAHNQAS